MSGRKPIVLPLAFMCLAGPALAVPYDGNPKILLHLSYPTTKGFACERGQIPDCRGAAVNGYLFPDDGSYFIYLLVATGNVPGGVTGLELSVEYDDRADTGVEVWGWNYCVDAFFAYAGVHGVWPHSLSSNIMAWSTCHGGEVAVAGYFYVGAYSPDTFGILPRIVSGQSALANCNYEKILLNSGDLGRIRFSSEAREAGCNPCVQDCTTQNPVGRPIPVQATTWSSIKIQAANP